jgi:hypothetical protein
LALSTTIGVSHSRRCGGPAQRLVTIVLREAIRQRGDVAAIFPDGVIDFGFEAQFGENVGEPLFGRFAGKFNVAGADHRASAKVVVNATPPGSQILSRPAPTVRPTSVSDAVDGSSTGT